MGIRRFWTSTLALGLNVRHFSPGLLRLHLMGVVHLEEGNCGLKDFRLARQLLGRGGHLFGSRGILLDHLIELLDGLAHLRCAGALLDACGGDLAHQFRGLLDVGHQLCQQLAGPVGRLYTIGGEPADLRRRGLAAFGQFANLRGDHRETLSVLAGARRFYGRIQGQQIGLASDFFDDVDLFGDLFHRLNGPGDSLAAGFAVLCRLGRDLVRLPGVVRILLDAGGHLLHGGGALFRGGGLLCGALRKLLRRGAHLFTAAGDVGGRSRYTRQRSCADCPPSG